MTVLRKYYTNFTSGEISPLLSSRVDSDAYRNGAKRLTNVRIKAQGGVVKRPGMRFLADLGRYGSYFANSSNYKAYDNTNSLFDCQLESFVYDENEAYILLFGAKESDNNGTLHYVDVSNYPDFYNSSGNLAKDNGQNVAIHYEVSGITTQWGVEQIRKLKTAQSRDTMYVVHPDKPMQVVTRTAVDTFTVTPFAFDTSAGMCFQPYHKFAGSAVTITPSGTSGSVTLTASSSVFVAGHDDTYIRLVDSAGTVRHALITAYTSGTAVTATLSDAITNTNAITDWSEQVFSSVRGYARTVQFHDQRLIFGGSRDLPNYLFTSKSGVFTNFDVGTGLDDESIQVQIAEAQVSEIKALQSAQHLSIFTSEQELYVPTTENKPLTPATITIKKQTSYGSGDADPVDFDGASVFITKSKGTIREFLFSDLSQNYKSDSITILSPEVVGSPIKIAPQDDAENHVESYLYSLDGERNWVGPNLPIPGAGNGYYHGQTTDTSTWFAQKVNTDDKTQMGDMAVFMSIRKEKLNGWAKWETNGVIRDVVTVNRRVYALVHRQRMESLFSGYLWEAMVGVENGNSPTVGEVAFTLNTGIGNPVDGYQSVSYKPISSGTRQKGEFLIGADANATETNIATAINADYPEYFFAQNISGSVYGNGVHLHRLTHPAENFESNFGNTAPGNNIWIYQWSNGSNDPLIEGQAGTPAYPRPTRNIRASLEVFDENYQFDCSTIVRSELINNTQPDITSVAHRAFLWNRKRLDAIGDGLYLGRFSPNVNGVITLPDGSAYKAVEVGIPQYPVVETLAPEENLEDGVTVGEKRRLVRAILDVKDTLSIKAGNTDVIKRNLAEDLTTAPTPTTARKTVHLLGWTDDGTLIVTQSDPLSFGLNGIVTEIEV